MYICQKNVQVLLHVALVLSDILFEHLKVSLSQYCLVCQSFTLTNVTYEYFNYKNVTYVNTCYLCSYGFLLLFYYENVT